MWQNLAKNISANPIVGRIKDLFSAILTVLKPFLYPHFVALKDFQFTVSNPLFWLFFLILLFFLNCFWKLKKAFVYCFMVAGILLITTGLEYSMADVLSKSPLFDYMVLRYLSLFIILCVSIYFLFIKLD